MKIIANSQVSAISWLTLKENLRGKVFLILIFTGLTFISISLLFPVVGSEGDNVKLIESMCLRIITFFGMMIGALLSSTSIPKDIEDKSIYSILTKPVNKLNIVLGKILGIIYVIGVTVILLSCFSLGLIRYAAYKYLPDKSLTQYSANNEIDRNIKVVSGDEKSTILTARKQANSVKFQINGESVQTAGGINWIEGDKGTAVWDISDLKKNKLGKEINIEMFFHIEGENSSIPVGAVIINPVTQIKVTSELVAQIEKKLNIKFDSQLINKSSRFILELSPKNRGSYLGVKQEDVKIFYDSVNYEYNFLKAVTIIFFQIVLIIFMGVACSTFLITPAVSISLVLFILFCGYMIDYLKDFESVIDFGGFHGHDYGHDHGLHLDMEPGIFFNILNNTLKYIFSFLTFVIPNLNKFDTESFILNRMDIPFQKICSLFGYTLIYLLSCIGVSALIVRRREI